MSRLKLHFIAAAMLLLAAPLLAAEADNSANPKDDGYRGIWYNIGTKYSGGMATYTQQIRPFAVYSAAANKTFFCYGGRQKDKYNLLHMVSYYDHSTGQVPRPTIVMDKRTTDAHDNPCLAIDEQGYIWIFSNTHGAKQRSRIHRSREPYSIESFETIDDGLDFSYGQAWTVPGEGLFFLHNRYDLRRAVVFQTCRTGSTEWSETRQLAQIRGQYGFSATQGSRIGVAFIYFPNYGQRGGDHDTRTNPHYMQSDDFGKTWTAADGAPLEVPLTETPNPALVHDYWKDKTFTYFKDVTFDNQGRPVLLYLLSKGKDPGPENGPRQWVTAHWVGDHWRISNFTTSDHNYDFGQLAIEKDDVWRIFAPTDPGPQAGWTGGEVVMWQSHSEGKHWNRKVITSDSARNHSYVRLPVNAHPDFYAYWADGDPTQRDSESRLWFCNQDGTKVWQLPQEMDSDFAKPVRVR